MPGNTGIETLMLLFLISLTFNLVSVCVGGTALCCLYRDSTVAMQKQEEGSVRGVLPHKVWRKSALNGPMSYVE